MNIVYICGEPKNDMRDSHDHSAFHPGTATLMTLGSMLDRHKRSSDTSSRVPSKNAYLVGGFNHLEKYYIVNGKDYPIHYGK